MAPTVNASCGAKLLRIVSKTFLHPKWFSRPFQVYSVSYPSLQQKAVRRLALANEVSRQVQSLRQSYVSGLSVSPDGDRQHPKMKGNGLAVFSGPVFTELEKRNIEKAPKPFCCGRKFCVPLERLLAYPRVNRLCDDADEMRALLEGTVRLSRDGSAVTIDLHDEDGQ